MKTPLSRNPSFVARGNSPMAVREAFSGRKIGYARVSTVSQKLDMQLDALNAAACDVIFKDHGVSGAKAQRPGLTAALKEAKAGDMLVVYKLDRLGRSVVHLADLIRDLGKQNIAFCSLSEGIDTQTPGGKLTYHVFSAVAEFQRDLIRENTLLGIEAARARGKKIGRPFAIDDQTLTKAVRLMEEQGYSAAKTARTLGVAHSTLSRSLKLFRSEVA